MPTLAARLVRARHRDRAVRRGRFVVEGPAALGAAAAQGWAFDEVVFCKRLCTSGHGRRVVQELAASPQPPPIVRVDADTYRRLSNTPRASGVLAVLRERYVPLEELSAARDALFLAAFGIRSEGNLGTMLRTLLAVGGAGLLCLGERVDPFAAGTVRATMGAVLGLPTARAGPDAVRTWAQERGVRLVGASPGAGRPFDAFDFAAGPTVLVLGEERRGLAPSQRALCDEFVHLPIVGAVDSLNVGVAASVLLYEALRQRRGASAPS